MTAVADFPTSAPAEAPAIMKKTGLWRCGSCAMHNHQSCPGAVRLPKHGLWVCFCCGVNNRRCLECGATSDIDADEWKCLDRTICQGRVDLRRANSSLWRMLQECKVAGVNARRRRRLETARIWRNVPTDEEAMLEQERKATTTARRGTAGQCECCGATTKGGRFLPGHDAKLKSKLRKQAKGEPGPDTAAAIAELKSRGWE